MMAIFLRLALLCLARDLLCRMRFAPKIKNIQELLLRNLRQFSAG